MKKLISMMAIIFAVTFTSLSAQSAEKLSPAELMKLRTEWDNRLREGAEKIAANPPQFELHYFEEPLPQELTDSDYENETMSFKIIIPYLKQIAGFENIELANSLLDELHKIPESKNWGDKINGFPWSYAEDIGNDNWMLKALSGHVDKYNFIISIVDENKNILVQKPISYMVCYAKQYSGFIMVSDQSGYSSTNSAPEAYENDTIYFLISIKNVNIDKLTVQVENRGKQNLAILPAEEGAVRYDLINNDKVFRYLKIVGNVNYNNIENSFLNKKLFPTDENGMSYIDFSSTYDLRVLCGDRYDDDSKQIILDSFLYNGKESSFPLNKKAVTLRAGAPLNLQENFKDMFDSKTGIQKFTGAAQKRGSNYLYDMEVSIEDFPAIVEIIQDNINKKQNLKYKDMVFCFKIKGIDYHSNGPTRNEMQTSQKFAQTLQNSNLYFAIELDSKANRNVQRSDVYFKNFNSLVEIRGIELEPLSSINSFAGCKNLEKIWLKSAETITKNTFTGCDNLEGIYVSGKVGIIDSNAFADCDKLEWIYIQKLDTLLPNAFDSCENLIKIEIPKSFKKEVEKEYPELKKKKIFSYIN